MERGLNHVFQGETFSLGDPPSVAHVLGQTREYRSTAVCVVRLLLPEVVFHKPVVET